MHQPRQQNSVDRPLAALDAAPVTNIELGNGLRIIVQSTPSSKVASVQAWIHSGSITEGEFRGSGLSHFLEHMAFKGTTRRKGTDISHAVQGLGGYMNAYTTFERTVYYIDLPNEKWKDALDIIIDSTFRSILPEDEFEKEREVIRREFAMSDDDPDRELMKLLFRTAYTVHPCRHPVIGHLDLFNKLTYADLLKYYRREYVPANTTVILTGNIDPAEAEAELKKLTADIPSGNPLTRYIPDEPRQLGRREAHETFPTDVPRLFAVYHIPPITHPDLYALDVLANISGQGQSSRLYQTLVEKEKILRAITAFSYTPAQSGLWGVSAIPFPDQKTTLTEISNRIIAFLQNFAHEPVSDEEISKAKRQAIAARASELKTASGRAASLGHSWLTARDTHFGDHYLKGIETVTAKDILRVARTYFTDENLTLVSLQPKTTEQISPSILTPAPVPQQEPLLEKLSNGAPLILVRDTSVPLVTIRITGRGGLLAETAETCGLGTLLARMLDKGTSKRTAAQLATEIEGLGGSLSLEFGNNSFSISIEVLSADLDKAVELLEDMALHPSFPLEEIEKEKTKLLADLKIEADQPMALARNALRETMYGAHPYGLNRLGTPKSIASLNREQLTTRHAASFTAQNVILSVAGSFDLAEARELMERYFCRLRPSTPLTEPPLPEFSNTPRKLTISTPKEQAVIQIALPAISLDNPDRAALMLIDEALSDQGSRLFIRIRETQSLAYFVGSSLFLGSQPGYFLLYAGTDPLRSEHAAAEMLDELHLVAENGITQDELDRAAAKLLGDRLIQDQSAAIIAYRASLNHLYGLGIDYEDKLNDQVRSLKAAEVAQIASKYFRHPGIIQVIVQPTT